MPYEEVEENKIIRIANYFTRSPFVATSTKPLFEVFFAKSSDFTIYERSFNKIDTYFSYVGGLVGTIIGLIFVMEFYTEKAYEISLAKKVMLDNDGQKLPSNSFNIFYYIALLIKSLFSKCNLELNWPKTNLYEECCSEISMQLDIAYIVRKLMFFDVAFSKIIDLKEL